MSKKTREILFVGHPTQKKLLQLIEDGVDLSEMSLRELAKTLGHDGSPQTAKHHLQALVKAGFVNVINGKYKINVK